MHVAGGDGEFVEDPAVGERFVAGPFVDSVDRNGGERGGEFAEDVFCSLIDFVAESAIAVHDFDVKVDVATWGVCMLVFKYLRWEGGGATSSGIGYQRKPESVSTALRNAIWEGSFLELCCRCELLGVKITDLKLVM